MTAPILALGCSHTAGVGLGSDQSTYVDIVGKCLDAKVVNRARPGGNADQCLRALVDYFEKDRPKLVIAQWPNIFRRTFYRDQTPILENINTASDNFFDTLKSSELNFLMPWVYQVRSADLICRVAQIPIFHVYLESLDTTIVQQLVSVGVTIHHDEKLPDRTWFFDSAALDGIHHSAWCHSKWAERLIGIINEHTPR